MATYSEQKKAKPFDWNFFLNKEIKTKKELIIAKNLAGSWVTCACGNQCDIIPRDEEGVPKSPRLRELGMDFFFNIDNEDFEEAKLTLREIEHVSAIIIKQIKDENLNQ